MSSFPPEVRPPPGLIRHLYHLAAEEDRAALAALRRGLGKPPGAVAEMARHVVPFLPGHTALDADYYLIASLFGLHPLPWHGPDAPWLANLGAALRRLAPNPADPGAAGVERRFVALLNADRVDLAVHLRHAVALLRAHDQAVDWARLLRDLRDWDRPDRRVQGSWARSFWTADREPPEGNADRAVSDDPAARPGAEA